MSENKIIYIKLTVNGQEFLKCTSTNQMQKDIEKIIEKNFKKGIKTQHEVEIISEHGKAYS